MSPSLVLSVANNVYSLVGAATTSDAQTLAQRVVTRLLSSRAKGGTTFGTGLVDQTLVGLTAARSALLVSLRRLAESFTAELGGEVRVTLRDFAVTGPTSIYALVDVRAPSGELTQSSFTLNLP